MKIDMSRFKATFFEEVVEHLATIESGLLALETAPENTDLINDVFRAAHSIKGSSGMFGIDSVSRFTHVVETVLDRMRHGELGASPDLIGLLLKAKDAIAALIEAAKDDVGGSGTALPETSGMEAALAAWANGATGATVPQPTTDPHASRSEGSTAKARYRVRFEPGTETIAQGLDPLLLLRDLAENVTVVDVAADTARLPDLDALDPESCYLGWSVVVETENGPDAIKDVFVFASDAVVTVEPEVAAVREEAVPAPCGVRAPEARPGGALPPAVATPNAASPLVRAAETLAPAAAREVTTLRVPASKVDRLIDLVGEVVIAQSIIIEAVNDFTPDKLPLLQEAVLEMERNTHELQQRVMGIRMVPVGTVFNRFPRLVRDLSTRCGKDITLALGGEEVELDKGVVEGLSDPLTHLVRNAVDHGIEDALTRAVAGKPSAGTITLTASHRGGSVVISVGDDGGGLDAERIRAKAVTRGLVRPEDVLDEARIHALIFEPGFSTAEAVSDISGRGVGMDVVRRNIEALNGSVTIHSAPGRGTTFEIRLPLTLAILDGLTVGVGADRYVVPLTSIVESLRPERHQIKNAQARGEIVLVRGEPLPLLRLHRIFGVAGAVEDPGQGLVVIIENDGERLALLVDDLLGQSQVVIKNLESNYRRVEGVMGATVMGDGRVALILDVQGLVRLGRGAGGNTAAGSVAGGAIAAFAGVAEVCHG